MSSPFPSEPVVSPAKRLPSIRLLFILIVLLPVVIASAALFTLAQWTGHSVSNQQALEAITTATNQTSEEVTDFLTHAVRLSELYSRRIGDAELPTTNFQQAWLRSMANDLATTPEIASICFGNPAGEATWLSRVHNRMEFGLAHAGAGDNATELLASTSGAIASTQPLRVYHYDPRTRPWYETALRSHQGLWTPIYFWFPDPTIEPETGTGFTRAIRSPDGKLLGVLVIDVTLGGFSEFLQHLPLTRTGYAFIVDDQDMIVAASHGSAISQDGKRISLEQSTHPAARVGAQLLAANSRKTQRVFLGDDPAQAQVASISPYPGINWRLIAVLPESSFLAEAHALRRRALIIGIIIAAGALLLGFFLSRRAAQPILELTRHVAQVGSGDFETRLSLSIARELHDLSEAINRMSAGLRHRLELQQSLAVATHVQQSLLPQNLPCPAGLDVAAHSKYCDETGGDYYDFIDIAELPNRQTLVAVGDVTGHGIGAALVMATARGSVRASAVAGISLGQIMSRVNHVLAADARHGLFMTLALLILDPYEKTVRYASAGHDAPILYDPHKDTFEDLKGASIPLGIEDDVHYDQYLRADLPDEAILLVGTDGIWEARDASGTMFGKDRLKRIIRDGARKPAAAIARALDDELCAYTTPNPMHDDVTFVILKLQPIDAPVVSQAASM
ncbi:MAG TPA: SpoIIE family protein phosphatase [Tepidisphaeraceae bacterium]|jgi:sigma-B regulation protein RsbU (phosphoserine phosphatase)